MYSSFFQTHRKTIIVSIILLFAVVTAISVFTYVSRIGKIGVTLSIVPSSATVVIDGKQSGKGTIWIKPGVYPVKVSEDGYRTTEKQIVVSADKKRNVVAVSLTPESEDAKKWAEKNQQAYKNNEEFGSIEAQETGQYLRGKHPIVNVLPYTDPYFKIGYAIEKNGDVALSIQTPSPRYRYLAVQKIRELGFNPTDYSISFTQFSNPLEEKS